MRILIVENGFNDLKKSRMPLGSYFQTSGHEVFYACPDSKEEGVNNISMSRNSIAPRQLIIGCVRLHNLETAHSVDIVLSFRLIPNVLNYLVSFCNRDVKRVAVITGLGYAFISTNNLIISKIHRAIIKIFYRIASKRIRIIAQNPDDLADLGIRNGKVIFGSGVKNQLEDNDIDFKVKSIKLLYVGRLLRSKGVEKAIEIFQKLKRVRPDTTLTIAGIIDLNNPDSISLFDLSQLRQMTGINYLGYVENMNEVYSQCNVLLFPSIYREGVPRVILESLRHGLTIVTNDMPGCKETVKGNGFLLSEEKSENLVINYLSNLDSKGLLLNKRLSQELFKSKFSSEVIFPLYLNLIEKI